MAKRIRRGTALAVILSLLTLSGLPYDLPAPSSASAGPDRGKFPKRVLIIRHAEKPDDEDDPHLTSRGAARAAALPSQFWAPPTFPTKNPPLPNPDYLFATKKSSHSDRPVETVMPLSTALGLELQHHYTDKEHEELAAAILGDGKYAGKTVLICWHHGKIPALATDLVAKSPNRDKVTKNIPTRWDEKRFDRIWWLTYDASGNAKFADRPQKLLFGDLPD
jgi:hypothetical protein